MNGLLFEFDGITIFVLVMAVMVLILQLLLCYRAKKLLMKLTPLIFLAVSTIVNAIMSARVGGWDGIGYLFFVLLSFGLMIDCGLGWLIWAIRRKR